MNDDKPYVDDLALVKRMLRGEQAAFDDFFDRYYARVYRYCARRASQADAEEVAMRTIEQAMRRIETYRGEAALMTWIYQVTRSQLSAFFKREKKHEVLVMVDDDIGIQEELEHMASDLQLTPQKIMETEQHTRLVHLMLDYLPGDYGQMLEWKYIEGYSVEEIAKKLNMTPIAVQSALARSRKAFKEAYDKIMGSENVVPLPVGGSTS
jgi:RNA polymerase sigma-70 factor (ECF subfamily)